MNKEKSDSLLRGISSVLDSLGELAEKGRRLKQAVQQAENQSSADIDPLQQLTMQTEETDSGRKFTVTTSHLDRAKVDINVEDNVLHVKIITGQYIGYKDAVLTPGTRLNSVNLDNGAGRIEIHCSL